MLWLIHEKDVCVDNRTGETARELVAVHRFETGDAAMKRFHWKTSQLGQAETSEGLTYLIDGFGHHFTTAHAMPAAKMMAAEHGFKLLLHREGVEDDFVKEWDMPPGREDVMQTLDLEAEQAQNRTD